MTAVAPCLRWPGTATVVRFNWPKYVAVGVLVVAAVGAASIAAPTVIRVGLGAAATVASIWTVTSLAATWWVYDHARVYDHVVDGLGDVGEWACVHLGFDESGPPIAEAMGRPPLAVVDVALAPRSRASLRRARASAGERRPSVPSRCRALALPTTSVQTVFLTFAVHEVRERREQRALFAELARVIRPGGRLVITEHGRDLANAAVFGPAALHFQRAATWRRRAEEAGFTAPTTSPITPFVERLTWRR